MASKRAFINITPRVVPVQYRYVLHLEKMHSPVALILCAAIAFAGFSSQGTDAQSLVECLIDNGSNMNAFLRLLAHGDADHNVKCGVKCALESLNAVDSHGNCITEGLRNFHADALHDKINTCCEGASSIPDACEKVYSYQMCMRKADIEQLRRSWNSYTSS